MKMGPLTFVTLVLLDKSFDEFLTNFFDKFLTNFDFSEDFLTYNLLTIASFRIGVPSILLLLDLNIIKQEALVCLLGVVKP